MSDKKAYVDRKKIELDKWKVELEELRRMAKDSTGALKAKLDNQMVELQRLRGEGRRRLERVVDASEDAWDGFRGDVEHTWKAFRNTVNYFKSHFKEPRKSSKKGA